MPPGQPPWDEAGAAAGPGEDVKYWCREGAARLGIELDAEQCRLFQEYYQLILRKSGKVNLTAILEAKEAALKHFVDSLTCLLVAPLEGSPQVVDVGSGAGLPGIPVKIARPRIILTLVDSSLKKVAFLKEAITGLKLEQTSALHGRAEDLAHRPDLRARFDYALCRALAPLPVLLEYCLGFLRTGGFLIAFKGPAAAAEEEKSVNALSLLGGVIREVRFVALPYLGHRRRLIVVEKIKETPPKYPRRPGIPSRRPL